MIESLHGFDRSFFIFLNSFHASWLDSWMLFLSGQLVWVPFIGYIVMRSQRQGPPRERALFFLFLAMALVFSDVISSSVIKNIVMRPRPCRLEELSALIYSFGQKCGGRWGFVSSHAANSLALVLYSVRTIRPSGKRAHLIWIVPLLVAYSRIYLGVHYPGDILGGWVVGALSGWLFAELFRSTYGASR